MPGRARSTGAWIGLLLLAVSPAHALPRAYIVIDQKGIVAHAGDDSRYSIASVAKIGTALFALERLSPGTRIPIVESTVLRNEQDHSAVLKKGEIFTLRDVVSSMLVASTNVSAVSIASALGGDAQFLPAINQWAREQGLNATTFADSFGLNPRTQSSARDIARLLSLVEQRPLLFEIFSAEKDSIRSHAGRVVSFETTNPLPAYRSWRIFGKTGTTHQAGKCFAGFAQSGRRRVKLVLLGSRDLAADMRALLDSLP